MTFPFVGPVEVPTPTGPTHPTTKAYVDNGFSPAGHSHTLGPHAATHATAGSDPITPASIGASVAGHVHAASLVPFPLVTFTDAVTIAIDANQGTYFRGSIAGNRALGAPTNGVDGQRIIVEVLGSGADRTLTIAAAILTMAGQGNVMTIQAGKRWFGGLIRVGTTWYLVSSVVQA